jgi:pheromone shutdown protein TraB
MQEHTLPKAISDASAPDRARARATYASRAPTLLDERDSYIARRIDTTLGEGQTGVLFVGAAHRVEKKLPRDIVVRRIDI